MTCRAKLTAVTALLLSAAGPRCASAASGPSGGAAGCRHAQRRRHRDRDRPRPNRATSPSPPRAAASRSRPAPSALLRKQLTFSGTVPRSDAGKTVDDPAARPPDRLGLGPDRHRHRRPERHLQPRLDDQPHRPVRDPRPDRGTPQRRQPPRRPSPSPSTGPRSRRCTARASGTAHRLRDVLRRATLGVANRTLRCGDKVALYYRGRTLIVPVIDRGPYANGADWDLTEATDKALGIPGTATIGAVSLPRAAPPARGAATRRGLGARALRARRTRGHDRDAARRSRESRLLGDLDQARRRRARPRRPRRYRSSPTSAPRATAAPRERRRRSARRAPGHPAWPVSRAITHARDSLSLARMSCRRTASRSACANRPNIALASPRLSTASTRSASSSSASSSDSVAAGPLRAHELVLEAPTHRGRRWAGPQSPLAMPGGCGPSRGARQRLGCGRVRRRLLLDGRLRLAAGSAPAPCSTAGSGAATGAVAASATGAAPPRRRSPQRRRPHQPRRSRRPLSDLGDLIGFGRAELLPHGRPHDLSEHVDRRRGRVGPPAPAISPARAASGSSAPPCSSRRRSLSSPIARTTRRTAGAVSRHLAGKDRGHRSSGARSSSASSHPFASSSTRAEQLVDRRVRDRSRASSTWRAGLHCLLISRPPVDSRRECAPEPRTARIGAMPEHLLSVADARSIVLAAVNPLETELVPIETALDRVLADDIVTAGDVPPFACSAMDGFAIHAGPAGRRLTVVGESRAGAPSAVSSSAARRSESRPARPCPRAPTRCSGRKTSSVGRRRDSRPD